MEKRRKVLLQINVCNNIYSTGKIASSIGELAIDNGWESYIAYGRSIKPSGNIPIKIGSRFGIMLHAFEQRFLDNTGLGWGSLLSTKRFIKEIERIKPDIIHLHVLLGYYINFKVLFEYLATLDIPVVWTLHSCWELTGHCTHYDYIGCEKWRTECNKCPLKKEYPQSIFIDRSSTNFRQKKKLFNSIKNLHLVAVSEWLRDQVSMSYLKSKPISIIYNGIDLDKFYPSENASLFKQRYALDGYFVALGVASAWTPKKGVSDYYELSKILPEGYKIIMIGLTTKQIAELPSNIIGVEKLTDVNEMRDAYSMADVVLNLSYEESFGLTTIEGFACGTPSIVYNRTASPELVSDETGYVVKAGDVRSVCQKMMEIKDKGKPSYSKACINRAKECFDKDKNYMKYLELYDNLLTSQETVEPAWGGQIIEQ